MDVNFKFQTDKTYNIKNYIETFDRNIFVCKEISMPKIYEDKFIHKL